METTINEINTEELIKTRVETIINPNKFRVSESKFEKSSYIQLVCQTVIGSDDLEEFMTESKNKRKLPNNFAQNLIELENIIDIHHSKIDEETIEKLAELYKVEKLIKIYSFN